MNMKRFRIELEVDVDLNTHDSPADWSWPALLDIPSDQVKFLSEDEMVVCDRESEPHYKDIKSLACVNPRYPGPHTQQS